MPITRPSRSVAAVIRTVMAGGRALGKLARARRGATTVEYGFLLAVVVIAIMAALAIFGRTNLDIWTNVAAKVTAA